MLMPRVRATCARVCAFLAWPLRLLDRQLPLLDHLLGRPLGQAEVEAITWACHAGRLRFGEYYHWKFRQIAQVAILASMDRQDAVSFVRRNDRSDYHALDVALGDPRGLLIAIPHHGPYLMGIIALCRQATRLRHVCVFYESPERHRANALFDTIHGQLFGDEAAKVRVLHNDHKGIANAIRALRAGGVVIILPDVFQRVDDTFRFPFCGMQRDFLLGSATIARRAGARILPVVAHPANARFGFANRFCDTVEPAPSDGSPEGDLHADYRSTLAMFRGFEHIMRERLVYWQYAHSHRIVAPVPEARLAGIPAASLLQDPHVNLGSQHPVWIQ